MTNLIHITNQEELQRHYQSLPDRVTSLTEFIGILEYRWIMQIAYFRGEPELYPSPCLPSIWRGVNAEDHTENGWKHIEQQEVDKFRGMVESGAIDDPYLDLINPPKKNSIEWLELAQHYGYPTRLLDVTLDPFVALFFAVNSSSDKDGCVYLSNGSSFNTLDPNEFEDELHKFFEIYNLRGYSPADDTLFLYRPLAKNRRMVAQRGQFVWCRGIARSLRATDTRIVIPSDAKPKIKKTLDRFGYTSEVLLP